LEQPEGRGKDRPEGKVPGAAGTLTPVGSECNDGGKQCDDETQVPQPEECGGGWEQGELRGEAIGSSEFIVGLAHPLRAEMRAGWREPAHIEVEGYDLDRSRGPGRPDEFEILEEHVSVVAI